MKSNNLVILRGHLGAAPETKYMPSGKRVVELRMATNHVWRDQSGNRQERTDWHRVSVFGNSVDFCANYLSKGDHVLVMGSIRNDVVDKADGSKQTYSSIRAIEVTGLSGRPSDGAYRPPPGASAPAPAPRSNLNPEALPF